MTNNEKFNALLNSCQHPQAVYDALLAFAETVKERKGETLRLTSGVTYAAAHRGPHDGYDWLQER